MTRAQNWAARAIAIISIALLPLFLWALPEQQPLEIYCRTLTVGQPADEARIRAASLGFRILEAKPGTGFLAAESDWPFGYKMCAVSSRDGVVTETDYFLD